MSTNVSTPLLSGSYGSEPDGVPYQLFSTDLGLALLSNGERCCGQAGGECPVANPPLPGPRAPTGNRDYYLRSASGRFQSLLTTGNLAHTALGPAQFGLLLVVATPDLGHVVLSSCAGSPRTRPKCLRPRLRSGRPALHLRRGSWALSLPESDGRDVSGRLLAGRSRDRRADERRRRRRVRIPVLGRGGDPRTGDLDRPFRRGDRRRDRRRTGCSFAAVARPAAADRCRSAGRRASSDRRSPAEEAGCRKPLRKKKVRGKVRCVKVVKRTHHRDHHRKRVCPASSPGSCPRR